MDLSVKYAARVYGSEKLENLTNNKRIRRKIASKHEASYVGAQIFLGQRLFPARHRIFMG